MNPVIVRDIKIGEGRPKICVPLVGATEKEILDQAAELSGLPVDIVEWRADWFEEVFDFERVNQVLVKLREAAVCRFYLPSARPRKAGRSRSLATRTRNF